MKMFFEAATFCVLVCIMGCGSAKDVSNTSTYSTRNSFQEKDFDVDSAKNYLALKGRKSLVVDKNQPSIQMILKSKLFSDLTFSSIEPYVALTRDGSLVSGCQWPIEEGETDVKQESPSEIFVQAKTEAVFRAMEKAKTWCLSLGEVNENDHFEYGFSIYCHDSMKNDPNRKLLAQIDIMLSK